MPEALLRAVSQAISITGGSDALGGRTQKSIGYLQILGMAPVQSRQRPPLSLAWDLVETPAPILGFDATQVLLTIICSNLKVFG